MIFYITFTWKTVNQPLLPFSVESCFHSLVLLLKLMLPYTINLLVNFWISPIPVLTFPLPLVLLLSLCTNLMKVTRKQLKEYFDIFEVQFSSRFITVQEHLHCWLVSLILIGLVTLMIESILQLMYSLLVYDLLRGLVRKNLTYLFLRQRKSIMVQLKPPKNPCGFMTS